MNWRRPLLCLLVMGVALPEAWAEAFRVTTLRAAPGQLEPLLGAVRQYESQQRGRLLSMRHSQGDHWDLLLLEPAADRLMSQPDFSRLVDFQHTFYAESGASFKGLQHQAQKAGLYHVEMFRALAGKHTALLDQRARENQYLAATGQQVNVIFTTRVGSDVDVFTLGFHADLAAFAAGPAVTDEEAEAAAQDAGFKNRADIGFYLRSLLASHHDTLAVPID